MGAEGEGAVEVEENLDGVGGVRVLRVHEPAGLIRADGKEGQGGWAEAGAEVAEDFAVAVRGVAGKVDGAVGRGVEEEAGPEGHAAVAQGSG